MNINATLFIQMFNFLITYVLLRFLLFKPAITIIQQEKTQEENLSTIIEDQKKSLEIQEQHRQDQWHKCQEYFINHQPHISHNSAQQSPVFTKLENDTHITNILSEDTIQDVASEIYKALEEKIKHVH